MRYVVSVGSGVVCKRRRAMRNLLDGIVENDANVNVDKLAAHNCRP